MNMIYAIWAFFLRVLGLVENHTKTPALDGGAPNEALPEDIDELLAAIDEEEPAQVEPPKLPTRKADWELILARPFDSPLEDLPTRRYPMMSDDGKILVHGVYSVFGRAPKETTNLKYPKAKLKVISGFKGTWNNNKPRLYMEVNAEAHFKEALVRADVYGAVDGVTSAGSYNHRHIRFDPTAPLSYHASGIAIDMNPGSNRAVNKYTHWQRRIKHEGKTKWVSCAPHLAKRGPVHTVMPYSKQHYEVFPKCMPIELVASMKSCYFSWGGDWGRYKWMAVVSKFGVGYDQKDPAVAGSQVFKDAMKEWRTITYSDGMHFELTLRGDEAIARWESHKRPTREA